MCIALEENDVKRNMKTLHDKRNDNTKEKNMNSETKTTLNCFSQYGIILLDGDNIQ